MKLFVAVLALVALCHAEDWTINTQEDLLKSRAECVQALKVPADYVEKFKKWDFPDDQTTHCYVKCIFEKFGLFESGKGFNIERLVQQLAQNRNKDEVRADIEKCVDKNDQKTDECQWAYRGLKCFLQKHLTLVQQSVKN